MQPMKYGESVRQDLWNKSVNQVLEGNVSLGSGTKFDVSGYPTAFTRDNGAGIMIRVGPGMQYQWAAVGTLTTIQHSLGKVPLGYIVVRKDRTCDVFDQGTATWSKSIITLSCTDSSADTTLYIF